MEPTRTVWTLAPDAANVSTARRRVTSLLRVHGWDDEHLDTAALLTTELTSNAVEHARTAFTVTVDVTNRLLRVDVRDTCTELPVVGAPSSAMTIGGRGLVMVAALAERWGHESLPDGKSVWFELQSRAPVL